MVKSVLAISAHLIRENGRNRARTCDPQRVKLLLSQLSYPPAHRPLRALASPSQLLWSDSAQKPFGTLRQAPPIYTSLQTTSTDFWCVHCQPLWGTVGPVKGLTEDGVHVAHGLYAKPLHNFGGHVRQVFFIN